MLKMMKLCHSRGAMYWLIGSDRRNQCCMILVVHHNLTYDHVLLASATNDEALSFEGILYWLTRIEHWHYCYINLVVHMTMLCSIWNNQSQMNDLHEHISTVRPLAYANYWLVEPSITCTWLNINHNFMFCLALLDSVDLWMHYVEEAFPEFLVSGNPDEAVKPRWGPFRLYFVHL
jgi:hypothetical protein